MKEISQFPWIISMTVILYVKRSAPQELPKYLQDMIDQYRANHFPNGTAKETFLTMDPYEYLPSTAAHNRTGTTGTSYLDRYSLDTDPGLEFNSEQIRMFTKFPDDSEEVYTGPTMDPNDLVLQDAVENTDGWQYFGVDFKLGTMKCPLCTKKFRKEQRYYDHLLKVENMTTPVWFAPTDTAYERYKSTPVTCPDHLCTETLDNFGLLRLHLLEVHNGLPHNFGITSDEYVRDFVKEQEQQDREEYERLRNKTKRPYVRRSNTTRPRRTKNFTRSTRVKRKYVKSNTSRRRLATRFTAAYTIIDEDYMKNTTAWINEYN